MSARRAKLRSAGPWGAAAAAYLVGALAFTWPMAARLSDAVWGDRFDAWTTMWLIWHLADALGAGELAAVTDRIFYPEGYNLWSFGHAAIQALGAPLIWLGASVPAAYNLLLLGAFWGTAMAGHALGRRASGSHWGGLLAGALFAWNPYLYGEMRAGCVELVAAWFLPLQALLWLRLFERPGWRRALAAAICMAMIGPFNWYYTVFTGMFTVALFGWRALLGGSNRTRALAWGGGAVVLAACLNLPLLPHVRQETPERHGVSAETFAPENWDLTYRITNGQVPLEEVTPEMLEINDAMQVAVNSTSLSNLVAAAFTANPLESTPGALAWAFGLFGWVAAGRRARGWGVIALGFTGLTLGPFLQIDATPPIPDWSLDRPLPYYWLYNEIPFFSKAYRPYRIGVVTLLCLSALAASGIGRSPRRWRPVIAGAGALAAASWPHWASSQPTSQPMADASIPEIYTQLQGLPDGAVIELPLHYQPLSDANARFQYHQIAHQKPMLNCNQLIRRTDLMRFQAYVAGNRFLATVLDLSRREPPYAWSTDDLNALRGDGFRYVIAHPAFVRSDLQLAGYQGRADRLRQPAIDMLRETFGAPALESEGTWVFEIPELPAGEERAWPAGRWSEVELPWAELELPVILNPGGEGIGLDPGAPATRLSLWVHAREGADGERGALFLTDGDWDQEIPLGAGQWRWAEVILPPPSGDEPRPWRLIARDAQVVLELDAVQFERASIEEGA